MIFNHSRDCWNTDRRANTAGWNQAQARHINKALFTKAVAAQIPRRLSQTGTVKRVYFHYPTGTITWLARIGIGLRYQGCKDRSTASNNWVLNQSLSTISALINKIQAPPFSIAANSLICRYPNVESMLTSFVKN